MKNKFFVFLTFIFGAAVALSGVYAYGLFFSFKKNVSKLERDYRSLKNNQNSLKEECSKTKKRNVLLETENKKLRKDKDELDKKNLMLEASNKKTSYRLLAANETIGELKEDNKRLVSDVNDRIKNILSERGILTGEIDNLRSQVVDYKKRVETQESLPDDILELKNKYVALQAGTKKIEDKNIKCSTRMIVLTEKVNRLKVENSTYKDTLSRSNNLIDVLQEERSEFKNKYEKAAANLDVAKKTVIELSHKNKKLISENNYLKKRVTKLPQSMAELAELKKQLKKEKTLFHYNLGVFYTQKGDYKKSAESFNKVIAINPQDADAQYNLGVIYSEYLDDKSKAIAHFRAYLNLAPADADADRARKYLLLQESIKGKM